MNGKPLALKHPSFVVPMAALGALLAAGCQQATPTGAGAPPSQGARTTSAAPAKSSYSDFPPLIQAAQKGDVDEVKKLISDGTDVNVAASDGTTALMRTTQAAVANALLDKGAKVDTADSHGRTALIYAAGDNDRGGMMGGGGRPGSAPKEDSSALVSLLLSHHADPNATGQDGTNPLMSVIAHRKPVSGPLDIAGSEDARVSKVKLLLAAGANVNAATNAETPDHLSAGETALMAAAGVQNADPKLINMLLAKGANVNAKDASGTTAVMKAARTGNADVVQILIDHHADVNVRNSKGDTPLSLAGRMKSVSFLKTVGVLTKAGEKQ